MSNYEKAPTAPATVVEVHAISPVQSVDGVALPAVGDSKSEKMSIPDHFLKLGCLACSVSYWDWPGCIGCRTSGTFLCFEGFVSRCKFVDTPVTPLLCTAADVECVKPRTCCQIYEQFFCFECFCAVPPTNDGYKTVPTGLVDVAGQVFPGDIPVWSAACCSLDSCNCDYPKCILDGCYSKSECCFSGDEAVTCKCLCWDETKPNPDSLCVLYKGQNYCLCPPKCCACKSMSRKCFMDSRCACPCDDDVPCAISCVPMCVFCIGGRCKGGCCMTLEQVKAAGRNGEVPAFAHPQAQQPGSAY